MCLVFLGHTLYGRMKMMSGQKNVPLGHRTVRRFSTFAVAAGVLSVVQAATAVSPLLQQLDYSNPPRAFLYGCCLPPISMVSTMLRRTPTHSRQSETRPVKVHTALLSSSSRCLLFFRRAATQRRGFPPPPSFQKSRALVRCLTLVVSESRAKSLSGWGRVAPTVTTG